MSTISQSKRKVLILCTGNTARSQMAEALWRKHGGPRWAVFSAGTSPKGYVHPLAIKVMNEIGIDISGQRSKSPDEYRSQRFDVVVTVCENAAKHCPTFPNAEQVLHWPFEDPALSSGSEADQIKEFRRVRDQLEERIRGYLSGS